MGKLERLTLDRVEDFWAWRYRDSTGFHYLQVGAEGLGHAVLRLEAIEGCAEKALRLIELIPRSSLVVAGLLGALKRWAAGKDVALIDFQLHGSVFDQALAESGFRNLVEEGEPSMPAFFSPLIDRPPINLMYRVPDAGTVYSPESAYVLKSDADMDRPATLAHLTLARDA
jgi:hypothetical protein